MWILKGGILLVGKTRQFTNDVAIASDLDNPTVASVRDEECPGGKEPRASRPKERIASEKGMFTHPLPIGNDDPVVRRVGDQVAVRLDQVDRAGIRECPGRFEPSSGLPNDLT